MPHHKNVDLPTRARIAAWIRHKMAELDLDQRQLAKRLGVNEATVSRALRGGSVGLDLVVALHRKLGISANALLDADPRPGD